MLYDFEDFEKDADLPDWSDRQQSDFDLWQTWKDNGEKPNDLRPLLQKFRPLIRKRANHWATQADLPPATVHAEFNRHFLVACKTYNPKLGAALGTWVTHKLQKAQRWVGNYQDPTRVQEGRYYRIGEFNNAKATLDDRLGRDPTSQELAEHLGWNPNEVKRLQQETRGTTFSGSFEGFDPTSIQPSKESEALDLVRFQLDPDEMRVYEHTIGYGGKEILKPGEISRKLGLSPAKVSRLRNSITEKLENHLKG
jgi:DNA-directed RNA polymerase specialized sigma subunit